jgi:hypothetical protein
VDQVASNANQDTPLVVRCIGPDRSFESIDWAAHFPGRQLDYGGVRFVFGGSGPSDVVVAVGYSRYDQTVTTREGGVWAWHLEPRMPKPYPSCYDTVFTNVQTRHEDRFVTAPPVLDWWLQKSFDELASLDPPEKTRQMSAIASTMSHIIGHRLRNDFVERVEAEIPEVEVFGRGRARPLEDKWEGLGPYRYSLVIENSSQPDYWTEKIADALLTYTVPLYFGATNIADYFPEGSYIWLPMDEPDRAIEVIRDTLANDSWGDRVEALRDARNLILNRYSLAAQISREVVAREGKLRQAPMRKRRIIGRRRKNGWLRGAGLKANASSAIRRTIRAIKSR